MHRLNRRGQLGARSLEKGGAELLLLGSNTLHLLAPEIEKATSIPLLHIAHAAAESALKAGCRKLLLLGTRFTMEQGFYQKYLSDGFQLDCHVPDEADREFIHQSIFDELCHGILLDKTRERFIGIIEANRGAGIDGVILGCTEIENLLTQPHGGLPLFPTTALHVRAAIDWALK